MTLYELFLPNNTRIYVNVTQKIPTHYNTDLKTIYCKELYSQDFWHEYRHALQDMNGVLSSIDRIKESLLYYLFYTAILFIVASVISAKLSFLFLIFLGTLGAIVGVVHTIPELDAILYARNKRNADVEIESLRRVDKQ
jgi:hypothetical protein